MTPALLLLGLTTSAPCNTSSIRLDWVRSAGANSCPSGQVVTNFIAERLGCTPFGQDPEVWFEVLVKPDDKGWRATMSRYDSAGQRVSDKLLVSEDPNCSILGEVVALTLALIAERLPEVVPPSVDSTRTSTTIVEVTTSTTIVRRPVVPAHRAATTIISAPPRGGVFAEAVLNVGTMPSAAFGIQVGGGLNLGKYVELQLGGLVLPVTSYRDEFFAGITAGWLGACGRLALNTVTLHACVRGYGGALIAFGDEDVEQRDPGALSWFATSVGSKLTTDLWGPVSLQIGVDGLITLVDRRLREGTSGEPPVLGELLLNEATIALLASAGLLFRFR